MGARRSGAKRERTEGPPSRRLGARAPGWRLAVAAAGDPERRRLEGFIHQTFAASYGARVTHFMPLILAIVDGDGAPRATVGVRPAATGRLFLERYLDRPAEREIGRAAGAPVARRDIVELGNLATRHPGMTRHLIVLTTGLLDDAGFEWVAFTANARVRNSFARLRIPLLGLAPADPARLGAERSRWGCYYDDAPAVLAGRIRDGVRRLSPGDALAALAPSRHGVECLADRSTGCEPA